jgi:formylglycine-generating enzyme required for sulfatase activity
VRLLVAILALALIAASPAHAEKRVALVIGNKDYKASVGPLTNPLNDIRLVSDALRSVGFEVLKPVENGTREEILRRIYEFASVLKDAGPDAVGFLYYSGHGVASAGENYLIPVDITEPSTEQLRIQGVKQSEVLAILRDEAPNAAHYLVLDACRNNLQGARGGKGFVPVGQQNGVLVAFSTEPGKTALDAGAASGPYAAALAAELTKPGQNDLLMFHNIRVDVMDKTNGDQVPWTEDGIERRERPVFAHMPPDQDRPTTTDEAAKAWAAIKDTKISAEVEIFLRRYPEGFYGDLARQKLAEIKVLNDIAQQENSMKLAEAFADSAPKPVQNTQVAVVAPPVVPAPSPSPCGSAPVTVSLSSRAPCPLSKTEEHSLKPKNVFQECEKCPEMVVVPSGSFMMGSQRSDPERDFDEEQVRVTIAKPFAVGKYAVTFDEWDACVADGGCGGYKPSDEGWGRGRRPVINVSWDEAQKYVSWISRKTGKPYRLLSEAEREYVTRAGTTTTFWWGSSITPEQANYDGSADPNHTSSLIKGLDRRKTLPVNSFAQNPWGLYQVHGNVWDWTQDCWNSSNSGNPGDGSARTGGDLVDCSRRVVRGGYWSSAPRDLRAANRVGNAAAARTYGVSFRVARTLSP